MPDRLKNLTGPEKAAILLMTMGEDFTADVFRRLGDIQIKDLGQAMSRIEEVDPETIQGVLGEFFEHITSPAKLRIKGEDFLKETISRAVTDDRVEEISTHSSPAPFETLRDVDANLLANFIRNEHPQTISLILAHLEPDKAAEILSDLPEELQADIILRIAELEAVPHMVLEEIEDVLKQEIASLGAAGARTLGGASRVAGILNQVDQVTENAILSKIEEDKMDLANEIRKLMFVFDDLVNVDDRGIRAILKEVSNEDLAMALKGASEKIKKRILSNLSERAAEMILEDIEILGPIRSAEVERAQQSILRVAKRLESEGRIIIGKAAGEDVFV